jgi:hypothetical protein
MKSLLAACALVLSSIAAHASTYSATFSFVNYPGTGSAGAVTGIVEGLQFDGVSAATSVRILTNDSAIAVPVGTEFVLAGASRVNTFTTSGGFVTRASFLSNFTRADVPQADDFVLILDFNPSGNGLFGPPGAVLRSDGTERYYVNASGANIRFDAALQPTAVPLPAGAALLLTALGVLTLTRRRTA